MHTPAHTHTPLLIHKINNKKKVEKNMSFVLGLADGEERHCSALGHGMLIFISSSNWPRLSSFAGAHLPAHTSGFLSSCHYFFPYPKTQQGVTETPSPDRPSSCCSCPALVFSICLQCFVGVGGGRTRIRGEKSDAGLWTCLTRSRGQWKCSFPRNKIIPLGINKRGN